MMPQPPIGTTTPTSPQGIPAILAALQGGGAPMGQMAKIPTGLNPSAPAVGMPAPSGPGGVVAPVPGAPAGALQQGSADPLSAALASLQPDQLQLILNALLGKGAFNSAVPAG